MTTEEQRTNREKSNANLIKYKPGESGNPGGKPAGKSITAELRKMIDEGNTAEEIAKVLIDLAKSIGTRGQVPAIKELLERTEGKVPDKHEIETGDISIVYKQVKGEK